MQKKTEKPPYVGCERERRWENHLYDSRGASRQDNRLHGDNARTFNQISQSADYRASEKSVSLTCCGGSYGGLNVSYWMTDKAGRLCRFTKIARCNTLRATDYKDPPVIVVSE